MKNVISCSKVLKLIKEKKFDEVKENCFYDWFCKDSSLLNKTKVLSSRFKSISKSKKFNLSKTSVCFKNNCPCVGRMYDDIRIANDKHNLFVIIPSSGVKDENFGKSMVYSREDSFKEPIIIGSWKDVKNWFLN